MEASLDSALTARKRNGSSIIPMHFVRLSRDYSPFLHKFISVDIL
jgi:hypothetical protein